MRKNGTLRRKGLLQEFGDRVHEQVVSFGENGYAEVGGAAFVDVKGKRSWRPGIVGVSRERVVATVAETTAGLYPAQIALIGVMHRHHRLEGLFRRLVISGPEDTLVETTRLISHPAEMFAAIRYAEDPEKNVGLMSLRGLGRLTAEEMEHVDDQVGEYDVTILQEQMEVLSTSPLEVPQLLDRLHLVADPSALQREIVAA